MAPLSRGIKLDKLVVKTLTHLNDTVSHALDFNKPLLGEFGGAKDGRDETSAAVIYRKSARTLRAESDEDVLDGRVRVHRSNNDLQLRIDPGLLLGAFTDERDGSNSFTIQTHVLLSSHQSLIKLDRTKQEKDTYLGERLTQQELVTLLDEISDGESVLERVTRGKALVGLQSIVSIC